jgi:hypothetical protein
VLGFAGGVGLFGPFGGFGSFGPVGLGSFGAGPFRSFGRRGFAGPLPGGFGPFGLFGGLLGLLGSLGDGLPGCCGFCVLAGFTRAAPTRGDAAKAPSASSAADHTILLIFTLVSSQLQRTYGPMPRQSGVLCRFEVRMTEVAALRKRAFPACTEDRGQKYGNCSASIAFPQFEVLCCC